MSCAALICFVGVFAEGSVDVLVKNEPAFTPARLVQVERGRFEYVPTVFHDRERISNPYGSIALGAAWSAGRFDLELVAWHRSSFRLRDSGDDALSIRARYWLIRTR